MSSEKKRQKALDAVGRLLPSGTVARAYGTGRANARMSTPVTYAIVGLLVLIVVIAVLTQRIVYPGILVVALFVNAIKPGRGVAVLDGAVVVVSLSAYNAKPKAVLGELPHAVLLPPHIRWSGKKAVLVPLGPDVVRFRAADYERLAASLASTSSASPDPGVGPPSEGTGPGWYPVNGDRSRQRYWDGAAWTALKNWDGTAWVDAAPSRH